MDKSSNNKPTISILLLCWNHAKLLEDCIHFLSIQTDKKFEVVFLDNKSEDGSYEVAKAAFALKKINVKMLRNKMPKGICANLNQLLAHSTGELICPLSTDDWYKPRFVEAVREAANRHPHADWYFGQRASASDIQKVIESEDVYKDGNVFPDLLEGGHPTNMNGVAYRRDAVLKVGGWDEAMCLEDYDLTFRLAQEGSCHFIKEPLAVFRSHAHNTSKNLDFMILGSKQFVEKHGHLLPRGGRPAFAENLRRMAARQIDLGNRFRAIGLLGRAMRTDPLNPQLARTAAYLVRRILNLGLPKSNITN